MPYFDLPFRREASAPIFDAADPRSILRYFEDLDLLFVRHQVSDDSEKKQAAVNYPAVEVERLWESAFSFADTARSYEDFKAEVIQLYPEASPIHQYSISGLQQLVLDRARAPIRSEQELTRYYQEFRLISHNLITMRRIGVQEQAHHFIAGLEHGMASDIHSRLKAKLVDHCPLDPYRTEDIFDAALYTLRFQPCAPLVSAPRDVSPPSILSSNASPSFQTPPEAAPAFPPKLECPSFVEVAPVIPAQVLQDRRHAPLSSTPRHDFLPQLPKLASPVPEKQLPRIVEVFPVVQAPLQAEPVPKTSRSTCPADTHLKHTLRHDPLPPIPALPSIPPDSVVSALVPRFLPSPQAFLFTPQSAVPLTSTLPSKRSAPSVSSPRDTVSLSTRPPDNPPPFHVPPLATPTFPPTRERPLLAKVAPASFTQVPSEQQRAPPGLLPRDYFSPPIASPASVLRNTIVPAPISQSPPGPQSFQPDQQSTALPIRAPSFQYPAPPVPPPRRTLLHLSAAPATALAIRTAPGTAEAILQAQTTPPPAPVNAAAVRCKVLLQAIADLKASLQATSAGPKAVRAHATVPGARDKKAPRCKFCGKAGHLIKDCKEADKYILAGKCKRNASGRIVLSSGADITCGTDCKTLQDRCDKWHRQNPGLQAAIPRPHPDNLADPPQRPVSQEAPQAFPQTSRATNPTTETRHPMASKVSARPHSTGSQAPKRIGAHRTPVPVPIPAPAAQQRTYRRLPYRTGIFIASSERISRTRRPVRDRRGLALARWEPERYSRPYRQPTACAMCVHVSAIGLQDGDHRTQPQTRLQVPQQHARWDQHISGASAGEA
jgi:hypothetical protein